MSKKYATAKLLFADAEHRGLMPQWETPYGLFSFVRNEKRIFVYYAKVHGNSQLGTTICQDKNMTRIFLEGEDFPNIPFCHTAFAAEIDAFFAKHQPIIQKPVLGERAQNVRLIQRREEIDYEKLDNWIFEKYLDATEYRCLVLNGKVIGMQKKILDPTPDHPWRKHVTNLEHDDWNEMLTSIACDIAARLHMGCMAVDFLVDTQGEARILELNSMPGIHSFHHPDAGKPMNMAALLLDAIIRWA